MAYWVLSRAVCIILSPLKSVGVLAFSSIVTWLGPEHLKNIQIKVIFYTFAWWLIKDNIQMFSITNGSA